MATSKDKLLQAFLRQQGKPRKRRSPVSPPPGGVRTRQAPGTVTVEKHGPQGFYDTKVTTDSLYQSPGSRKKPQFGALPAGGRSLIQPRKGRSDANVSLARLPSTRTVKPRKRRYKGVQY